MCSHYQGIKARERYSRYFGVEPPDDPGKLDLWPGYLGALIRHHPHAGVGDDAVPPRDDALALWLAFGSTSLAPGLSPGWIRAMHGTHVEIHRRKASGGMTS